MEFFQHGIASNLKKKEIVADVELSHDVTLIIHNALSENIIAFVEIISGARCLR